MKGGQVVAIYRSLWRRLDTLSGMFTHMSIRPLTCGWSQGWKEKRYMAEAGTYTSLGLQVWYRKLGILRILN